MTDLTPTPTATITCPHCGTQNARGAHRCQDCGTGLDVVGAESQRGDLELAEAWRAAGAGGYDTEVAFADGRLTCSHCGGSYPVGEARVSQRTPVRDTATERDDLVVLTLSCPDCGRMGRALVDAGALEAADAEAARAVPERERRPTRRDGEDVPADDRPFLDESGPGRLAERESMVDDEGEDVRQYTGEPVETDEGWVVPRQQNVGKGNMAGGGEF